MNKLVLFVGDEVYAYFLDKPFFSCKLCLSVPKSSIFMRTGAVEVLAMNALTKMSQKVACTTVNANLHVCMKIQHSVVYLEMYYSIWLCLVLHYSYTHIAVLYVNIHKDCF